MREKYVERKRTIQQFLQYRSFVILLVDFLFELIRIVTDRHETDMDYEVYEDQYGSS